MIILITNRTVTADLSSGPVHVMPNALGKDLGNNEIYAGIVVHKQGKEQIELYPRGAEKDLFDTIDSAELARPWVFFTHGNNQNTLKNIKKCRALESVHGVNVVAFSWPSQPYMEQDKFTKLMKKYAAKAALRLINLPMSSLDLPADATLLLRDYYLNYKQAQKNAIDSAPQYNEALQLTNKHLFSKLRANTRKVFLVHSLGHVVLQTFIDEGYTLPTRYDNTILHQADADADDHHIWIPMLRNKTKNIYITTNQYDSILAASSIANMEERLGQTKTHLLGKPYKYLDFSDGAWVDNSHNFFMHEEKGMNEAIFDLMNLILKGKDDNLPTRPFTWNSSDFSLISKDKFVYRLRYILDPTGDGDAGDDSQFIESLSDIRR